MIFCALAMMSFGNMMLLIPPVRTPWAMTSNCIVRFSPSRPPSPVSVKPKPS
jgi:hypothetical protein